MPRRRRPGRARSSGDARRRSRRPGGWRSDRHRHARRAGRPTRAGRARCTGCCRSAPDRSWKPLPQCTWPPSKGPRYAIRKGRSSSNTCHTVLSTFGSNHLKQGRFFSSFLLQGNGLRSPPFPGCNRNREKMNVQNHPHRRARQGSSGPASPHTTPATASSPASASASCPRAASASSSTASIAASASGRSSGIPTP